MTADHAVTTVHAVNERDPVPSRGVFHLTPANGRVYLAFQVRLGVVLRNSGGRSLQAEHDLALA